MYTVITTQSGAEFTIDFYFYERKSGYGHWDIKCDAKLYDFDTKKTFSVTTTNSQFIDELNEIGRAHV